MARFEQGYLIVQDALHYAEGTVTSALVGLPELTQVDLTKVRRVLIHNIGAPIRWIAVAGMDPTGAYGASLDADDILVYDGNPSSINFILDNNTTQTQSTLRVHYFGA